MNRRKFLIGLGATVGGGGALVGSGAFSSVSADRTAEVAIAEEDQAYLKITPTPNTANGAFASTTSQSDGEQLYLDFDNSIPDRDSQGVGQSSEYEFDDVFRIENQGTQTVYVNITPVTAHDENTLVKFYVRDGSGNRVFVSPGENDLELTTGAVNNIGVYIETAEESNYSRPDSDGGDATVTATASSDDSIVSP